MKASILQRIGTKLVTIIVKRTTEGKDRYGKPFTPYSKRPFAMPSGATTKRAIALLKKSKGVSWFTTATGAKWIVVHGGYAALKNAVFAKAGGAGAVNLTLTGKMLRSVNVIEVDSATNRVRIGFTRTEDAEKAYWNKERGRDFLGVLPEEIAKDADLFALIVEGLSKDL